MTDGFVWLEPWYPVDDTAICAGLEAQLRLEVSRRHVLHGEAVQLIARRGDTDDALFLLAGGRVAEVHMTWSKRTEPDPRWPATGIFASLDDWAHDSMLPLHRELSEIS
ncbi:hypothetical protein [Hyphomicrobium sp.]|uniref:hypothetical protein n=1 Tax=Hyphomicrobium sp. TaxID=82 RepID=UPI000FB87CD6|nr:hypothetical protein [Hyphomicrobium sp.]RUP09253.1 MAG: hypothetical protein EKK38_11590 [Hyphomicrobium sp.]